MNNEIHTCNNDCQRPACVAVREAIAAERERCAKLCDWLSERYPMATSVDCADIIRGKGNE